MEPLLPEPLVFSHDFIRDTGAHRVSFCLSRCSEVELESSRRQFLSSQEEARWQQFQFKRRQASYLLGRYCAKEAVAKQQGLSSRNALEIRSGVFQQPIVSGPGAAGIQVSLAHSGEWGVAVAFDEAHPMGIDLEHIQPDRREAIRSQLTDAEASLLSHSSLRLDEQLALLWTAKEALSKVLKTGLMTPFSVFEVSELSWDSDCLLCHFRSFTQYRAIGFVLGEIALGLVCPKRSDLGCPVERFRGRFLSLVKEIEH